MKLARFGILTLVATILSVVISLYQAPQATAAGCGPGPYFGRSIWCGYFENFLESSGNQVIFGGVPVETVDEFINFYNAARFSPDLWRQHGASFTMLTMAGRNQPGNGYVVSQDPLFYNPWEQSVRAVASYNGIRFHYAHPFDCGVENTYHQPTFNDDAFFIEAPSSGDGCAPGVTRDSIIFCNMDCDAPGRTIIFAIKRDCGNPIGEFGTLPAGSFNMDVNLWTGSFPTPGYGGIVEPGKTYHLTPSVFNGGNLPAPGFGLAIGNLSPGKINFAGISSPNGRVSGQDYRVGGCQGSTQCWHWDYNPGFPSAFGDFQADGAAFTVTGSNGDVVCFNVAVNPRSSSDSSAYVRTEFAPGVPYCFVIQQPRFPAVVANNSDVHAGGGACGGTTQPAASGRVQTLTAAGSTAEYVVSASALGGINNLKTNGTGADRLRLGNNGAYGYNGVTALVCRPDLVKKASSYATYATGILTPPAVFVMDGSTSGVYVYNGGDLHISGTISHRVTIVNLGPGNVIIDGNIAIDNALHSSNINPDNGIPSLGIISKNDIKISRNATRVDAYMFADGNIDTCYEGAVLSSLCNSTLQINGFVMSKSLSLRRLGPAGSSGAQTGEHISFAPQIYLNPPKLFDASVDDILLEGQGERQPLF